MSSSFFTQISTYMEHCNLNIDMSMSGGKLTVALNPKPTAEDPALKKLMPLIMSGTPEEMDAEFFEKLQSPLQALADASNNAAEFEAALKEAESKTKAAKAAEEQKKKDQKKAKELIPQIKEAAEKEEWQEARKLLDSAKALDPDIKGIKTLEKKIDQMAPPAAEEQSLFKGDQTTNPNQTEIPPAEEIPPTEKEPEPKTEESSKNESSVEEQVPPVDENTEPQEENTDSEKSDFEQAIEDSVEDKNNESKPTEESQSTPAPSGETVDMHLEHADRAITEERWDEARRAIDAAHAIDPNSRRVSMAYSKLETLRKDAEKDQAPQSPEPTATEPADTSGTEGDSFKEGDSAPDGSVFRCNDCNATSAKYYEECPLCGKEDGLQIEESPY